MSEFERGKRTAWRMVLGECLKHLDYPNRGWAKWLYEREAIISALRGLCDEYGDNDWTSQDHLGDVIEKHLAPYLKEKPREPN